MSRKGKKTRVTKKKDSIEFSLGDAGPTKYEIMTSIAQKHSIYGATLWLNTPLVEYENKTPAELMCEGQLDLVASLINNPKDESQDK